MTRLGLSEIALIALICAGALVIARAALSAAVALPCLTGAEVCAMRF